MVIQGFPIALESAQDSDMKERFWYWTGKSGQKYIHSVYDLDACPRLPGAVYVAVKRLGQVRTAVAVGRFAPFWDKTLGLDDVAKLESLGADEVHVHLLARSPDMAEAIKLDLASALGDKPRSYGFKDGTAALWVHAA
jgi:hypothetical protein